MSLESIRTLVQADLEATDQFITDLLISPTPLITALSQHILQYRGKRIRPMLVLLSAKHFECDMQKPIQLASAIEMIHTATLLHDDVIDHAPLRRGQATAHQIWGNEASVLVGDYLYSRAFQLIVNLDHLPVLQAFSAAMTHIAEGEVRQLAHCHRADTTESAYFDVITAKTAKLFEVAAQVGALLAADHPPAVHAMKQYGNHLGIAYQLIDDALDYHAKETQFGKINGNDLIEGKLTLPLIYAMQQGSVIEQEVIRDAIQTGSAENLTQILEIIESTKAIEYTAHTAKKYAEKASDAIAHFPDSTYRNALQNLAAFIVKRDH